MQRMKVAVSRLILPDAGYFLNIGRLGVHRFLRDFPSLGDDDIVFMMDALDVWLQLPPDTLLERYGERSSEMVVRSDVPESPVPRIAYDEGREHGERHACQCVCLASLLTIDS
jgi:hypothetical protein